MQILILLENDTGADEITSNCDAVVEISNTAADMATRLGNLEQDFEAVIVSPKTSTQTLRMAVAACTQFTVEVQLNNISGTDILSANADAELFGLGMDGYALACSMIEGRSA